MFLLKMYSMSLHIHNMMANSDFSSLSVNMEAYLNTIVLETDKFPY